MGGGKDKPEGVRVGWGLIASAIFLFLAPVASGVLYQSSYDQYAANRTREYANDANDQVGNSCRGVAATQQVICFANARIEADLKKRDNERNEADLVAQRKTALWTMLMGAAAFVGMALSLIGVILVFRTFGATREANEIARDTARRQLRAYVVVTGIAASKFEAGQAPVFQFEMTNIGQTPAKHLHVIASPFFYRGRDGEPKIRFPREPEGIRSHMTLAPNKPFILGDPLQGAITQGQSDALNSGEMGVIYAGIIIYRDIFRRRRMTTFKARFDRAAPNQERGFCLCLRGNVAG